MARTLLYCLVFFLISCAEQSILKSDLKYLNGYWEIKKVEFPNGQTKDYSMNPTIDFIQLDSDKGLRRKLQPKFDGSYRTSNDIETFKLIKSGQSYILRYEKDPENREEILVQLDSLTFTIQNGEGLKYTYSRFQPIQIPR
ncbi:MAG: hypothetical protein AAF969_09780 [Bacteroidota bacterium]